LIGLHFRRVICVAAACGLLSACGIADWFSAAPPNKLPGKRIAILSHTNTLDVEPATQGDITVPPAEALTDWPQEGGDPSHANQNKSLSDHAERVWTVHLDEGGNKRRAFVSQPIVAGDKVYTLDSLSILTAFNLSDGERLWRVDLGPDDAGEGSFGGGASFDEGKLYVTTNFAQIVALNAETGAELWRKPLPAPVRGAPTVRNGRLVMVTVDNETLALSAEDGHQLWRHSGISEVASLVGAPSPAIEGNTVIAPYTSGEIFALRIENGTVEWSDVLASVKRTDQVAELSDIGGLPVVDHGHVYAVGNSDVFAALDLRTGRRLWDKDVGGTHTPWIAGDYLYLMTNTQKLACFEARTGHVRWVHQFKQWEDEEDKSNRISWTGPVMAGGRLAVTSSYGDLVWVSPVTGDVLATEEMPDGISIPPVISGNTMLVLTEDGFLIAYR
jgi:outer membrane protein assembly factor BamB